MLHELPPTPFNPLWFLSLNWIQTDTLLGLSGSSAGKESTFKAGYPRFDSRVGKIPWKRDRLLTPVFLGFPGGSDGKEFAYHVGDLSLIPELGRYLREGNSYSLQYSGLENSMNRGAWQATGNCSAYSFLMGMYLSCTVSP